MSLCAVAACLHKPTMAIRTTTGATFRTTVYWDPADAPKAAELHCTMHGAQLLSDLAKTLGGKQ